MVLDDLVNTLPKAELHLHLEGTLEPEMLLDARKRETDAMVTGTAQQSGV